MIRLITIFLLFIIPTGCISLSQPGSPAIQKEVEPPYTSIKVNPLPFKVVHGDFNHDGREDMAVVSKGYLLKVYINKGDGSFSESFFLETYVSSTSAAVADFNQDGNLDIAMLTETHVGPIFLGDGKGGFTKHDIRLQGPGRGLYMDSSDLNNDGLPDLIATGLGGASIYVNKGNLQFETSFFNLGKEFISRYISAVDLNEDKHKDVIVPDYANGKVYVIWNNIGSFSSPQLVFDKLETVSSALPLKIDGQQCIVLSLEQSGQLLILDNNFNEKRSISASPLPYSLSSSDINNDTFADIIITHAPLLSGGKVTVLFGPSFEKRWENPAGGLPWSSSAFDWNLDSIPDLFIPDYSGSSVIYIPSPIK